MAALKYGATPARAFLLGDAILEALDLSSPLPDILVPVPMSPKRLRARGYNQAELIAKRLGCKLRIPVETGLLMKIRDTGNQAELNREQREQNLHNAIIATRPVPSTIKIGLVDDVITTGATLNTCLSVLERAGGRHFHLLAACRTPE